MSVAPIDAVIALVILFFAARTAIVGFVAEFFSKAAVIAGVAVAVLFYRRLAPYVSRVAGDGPFPEIVAFLLIFIVVYLAAKIVQNLAGNAFEGESMTNLDRAMGFFLGLAEGFLAAVVILIAVKGQAWFDLSSLTDGSVFARALDPFLSGGTEYLRSVIETQ